MATSVRRVGAGAARGRRHPDRPLKYGIDVRLRVVATATSEPPEEDSQWTHRAVAAHLRDSDGVGISESQVGRILGEADLKPHKVRGCSAVPTTRTSSPAPPRPAPCT